jgi:hypothetical protein
MVRKIPSIRRRFSSPEITVGKACYTIGIDATGILGYLQRIHDP